MHDCYTPTKQVRVPGRRLIGKAMSSLCHSHHSVAEFGNIFYHNTHQYNTHHGYHKFGSCIKCPTWKVKIETGLIALERNSKACQQNKTMNQNWVYTRWGNQEVLRQGVLGALSLGSLSLNQVLRTFHVHDHSSRRTSRNAKGFVATFKHADRANTAHSQVHIHSGVYRCMIKNERFW